MLSVEESIEKILSGIKPPEEGVYLPIIESLDRVLHSDVTSQHNVPPKNNSAMDGYAFNTRDCATFPSTLLVSQRITAGQAPQALTPGTAARIFTGGEIPEGANAVAMQENCEKSADGENVTILQNTLANENIRKRGQDIRLGDVILAKGKKLTPADIGLLASVGISSIRVTRKIKVAIVTTGNELIAPGNELLPGKIYNSNAAMLAALLAKSGCDITKQVHVLDSYEDTKKTLAESAENADIVLSCGGVSVGEEDHVKSAVESIGSLDFWKVRLKPGKPLAVGNIGGSIYFGLPGNPVSSFVTFLLFVLPAIRKLEGRPYSSPRSIHLPLDFSIQKPRTRREYLRVNIDSSRVQSFKNQSSGVLSSASWANALAIVPEDTTFDMGDMIEVIPFENFFSWS